MAYYDVAMLHQDSFFSQRVSACYAIEREANPDDYPEDPVSWTYATSWTMAAQPGFGDAYAYAVNTGVKDPGKDPGVITDAQILSAVQFIAGSAPV